MSAAANPAAWVPAKPAEFAEFSSCIIGDIIMLAGYIPICATCMTDCNGTAAAADCTPATTPGSPAIAPCAAGEIAAV
ncbi:hypothetical protein, partial [Mycobacterium marinum]|uniref:hypothetical protein n=1 Tax=Mycobacterium marinum TaxID=1781 RepID=UPI003B4377C3